MNLNNGGVEYFGDTVCGIQTEFGFLSRFDTLDGLLTRGKTRCLTYPHKCDGKVLKESENVLYCKKCGIRWKRLD
jgi:hypothetical protein